MSEITAHTGETRNGLPLAELRTRNERGEEVALVKVYASPEGTRLRIVLPELKSFKQVRIDIDSRLIEFERKA